MEAEPSLEPPKQGSSSSNACDSPGSNRRETASNDSNDYAVTSGSGECNSSSDCGDHDPKAPVGDHTATVGHQSSAAGTNEADAGLDHDITMSGQMPGPSTVGTSGPSVDTTDSQRQGASLSNEATPTEETGELDEGKLIHPEAAPNDFITNALEDPNAAVAHEQPPAPVDDGASKTAEGAGASQTKKHSGEDFASASTAPPSTKRSSIAQSSVAQPSPVQASSIRVRVAPSIGPENGLGVGLQPPSVVPDMRPSTERDLRAACAPVIAEARRHDFLTGSSSPLGPRELLRAPPDDSILLRRLPVDGADSEGGPTGSYYNPRIEPFRPEGRQECSCWDYEDCVHTFTLGWGGFFRVYTCGCIPLNCDDYESEGS